MRERYPTIIRRAAPAAAIGLAVLTGCGEGSDGSDSAKNTPAINVTSPAPSEVAPTDLANTKKPTPPKALPSDAATSSVQIICEGVFTYKNSDATPANPNDDTYEVVARPVLLNNAELPTVGVISEIGRFGVTFAELPLDEAGGPKQWYNPKGEPKSFNEIACSPQEVSTRKIGNTYVVTTQPDGPSANHIDAKALNPATTGMADWHVDDRLSYVGFGNVLDAIERAHIG